MRIGNHIDDVNKRLRLTAAKGDANTLQSILAKHKEQIEIDSTSQNGNTSLHWAIIAFNPGDDHHHPSGNYLECIYLLLLHSASLEKINKSEKSAKQLLAENGDLLEKFARYLREKWIAAAKTGNAMQIVELLSHFPEIDINYQDENMNTALHWVVAASRPDSPLHCAEGQYRTCAKILIIHGINTELENSDNKKAKDLPAVPNFVSLGPKVFSLEWNTKNIAVNLPLVWQKIKIWNKFNKGSHIRILELGCGFTPLNILEETLSRNQITFEYHGIDTDLACIEWSRKHFSEMKNGNKAEFHLLDGSNLEAIKKRLNCKENSFDFIIFRHPSILENLQFCLKSFCQIIPTLLKSDGLVYLSFYFDAERQVFEAFTSSGFYLAENQIRIEKSAVEIIGINRITQKEQTQIPDQISFTGRVNPETRASLRQFEQELKSMFPVVGYSAPSPNSK